ncbi:MAG TPA: DUF4333 domain-containing protein [Acidimicrobiales bacterium]|nr:DUF4333 domain-containing protein [Acidimicrobiales bacterium]
MRTTEAEASPSEFPEGPPIPPADGMSPIATGRRPRKRLVLVIVALVSLALAGLALRGGASFELSIGTDMLDIERGEAMIEQELTDAGVPVDGVTCPEREIQQGDVFECTAEVDGQELRIEVTQLDAEGTIDFRPLQALLDAREVEKAGAELLRGDSSTSLRLDCGTAVVLVKDPGDTFECPATTSDGERGTVVVTVEDVDGTVSFEGR